jgi:hypothetical protein
MEPTEFVAVMRLIAYDSAVRGTLANLSSPPGRQPPASLMAASEWFRSLDNEGRTFVQFVARSAAHATLFGVLAALDGVRVVDDPPHGNLRLTYVASDGDESLLNPPGADLHDELNALVHPAHEPLDAE